VHPYIKNIGPGDSANFALVFTAREFGAAPLRIDADRDERARRERVNSFLAELQLETPDPVLNTAFALAKIRAVE
jgi:hypothetical protein